MEHSLIVTMGPYAPHLKETASKDAVSGIRLNTVMPTTGSLEDVLRRMQDSCCGKELWIDLKTRQLRTTSYGVPPFTDIHISHDITVDLPARAYMKDTPITLLRIDGRRLIFQEGPRKVVGPGESINIPHSSLEIQGFFTDLDKQYIEAAEKVGIKTYMLSYVESQHDIEQMIKLIPDAVIRAKIESNKGLEYVASRHAKMPGLMAACGDLYTEVDKPHLIAPAMDLIIRVDPTAIAASRHFPSLEKSPEPAFQDIMAVYGLMHMGYKTFMLGDELCLERDPVITAINLFRHIAESYEKRLV